MIEKAKSIILVFLIISSLFLSAKLLNMIPQPADIDVDINLDGLQIDKKYEYKDLIYPGEVIIHSGDNIQSILVAYNDKDYRQYLSAVLDAFRYNLEFKSVTGDDWEELMNGALAIELKYEYTMPAKIFELAFDIIEGADKDSIVIPLQEFNDIYLIYNNKSVYLCMKNNHTGINSVAKVNYPEIDIGSVYSMVYLEEDERFLIYEKIKQGDWPYLAGDINLPKIENASLMQPKDLVTNDVDKDQFIAQLFGGLGTVRTIVDADVTSYISGQKSLRIYENTGRREYKDSSALNVEPTSIDMQYKFAVDYLNMNGGGSKRCYLSNIRRMSNNETWFYFSERLGVNGTYNMANISICMQGAYVVEYRRSMNVESNNYYAEEQEILDVIACMDSVLIADGLVSSENKIKNIKLVYYYTYDDVSGRHKAFPVWVFDVEQSDTGILIDAVEGVLITQTTSGQVIR